MSVRRVPVVRYAPLYKNEISRGKKDKYRHYQRVDKNYCYSINVRTLSKTHCMLFLNKVYLTGEPRQPENSDSRMKLYRHVEEGEGRVSRGIYKFLV